MSELIHEEGTFHPTTFKIVVARPIDRDQLAISIIQYRPDDPEDGESYKSYIMRTDGTWEEFPPYAIIEPTLWLGGIDVLKMRHAMADGDMDIDVDLNGSEAKAVEAIIDMIRTAIETAAK